MRKLTIQLARSVALTGGLLLAAATPCLAQAHPIVTADVEFVHPLGGLLGVDFSLVELQDGTLNGGGSLALFATSGFVDFDLTSYMFIGDTLCVAGPVTAAVSAPPNFFVGATIVFCMNDNGNGGSRAPDTIANTAGPPGLTIQQVIALIGPPPPQAFFPITAGNLKIH